MLVIQQKHKISMKKRIITVYYLIDNFCKIFHEWEKEKLLPSNKIRHRAGNLNLPEVLTIVLYFLFITIQRF
jgi:hypothetical protein